MKIREPKVRQKISPIAPLKYRVIDRHILPSDSNSRPEEFTRILELRRSRRKFQSVSLDDLGPLFYLSSRTKEAVNSENGLIIERRNVPSSGGLHTIDCFVSKFDDEKWYVYNSHRHSLDEVMVKDPSMLSCFKDKCQGLFDCSREPYLIWYVCDLDRLGCKYENPESLALREAGAIAAIQSLIAESRNLAFCMLGLTGSDEARALLDERQLLGVGTVVVGGLTSSC